MTHGERTAGCGETMACAVSVHRDANKCVRLINTVRRKKLSIGQKIASLKNKIKKTVS